MSLLRDSTIVLPGREALLATPFRYAERGEDLVLGFVPEAGEPVAMDRVEYALLDALRFPCLPGKITERLMAAGWTSDECVELPGMLGSLKERGLLTDLGEFLDGFEEPEVDDRPMISHLAWITRDRPETLKASLEAWGRALDRGYELPPAFVVADDSIEREAETRAVVKDFSRDYRGEVHLLDRAFRKRFAGELGSTDGVDAEALRFALGLDDVGLEGQGRYGSSRNLLLLALAGRAFVMVDDDTFPDFRLHPEAGAGLSISADFDPVYRNVFKDMRELESFGLPADTYPLVPHARMLGASVSGLIAEGPVLDLRRVDMASLARCLKPAMKVRALSFGCYGDSGIGTARYLLVSRSTMLGDAYESGRYEAAATNRLLFRTALNTTVGGGTFMGAHVAIDARSTLPPFSPSCRNEDGFWGMCLHRLHPDASIAYPAQAVRHAPSPPRFLSRESLVRWETRLNDICTDIVYASRSVASAMEERYAHFGESFSALARLESGELRRSFEDKASQTLSRRLAWLERELHTYNFEPDYWARDIEATRDYLLSATEDGEAWLPFECRGRPDAFKAYLSRLGLLLVAWPALFRAALERASGILEPTRRSAMR